jgi:hypothetical protein
LTDKAIIGRPCVLRFREPGFPPPANIVHDESNPNRWQYKSRSSLFGGSKDGDLGGLPRAQPLSFHAHETRAF